MKYALINKRGIVRKASISDIEPQRSNNHLSVVQLSDEQADTILNSDYKFALISGELVSTTMKLAVQRKVAELSAVRWSDEVAGITLPDGRDVYTDKETQEELGKALAIIATVNPQLEIDWKFPSGEVVHLDATTIQQIASAVFTHVQGTRTKYSEKINELQNATTLEEIDAIVW